MGYIVGRDGSGVGQGIGWGYIVGRDGVGEDNV